MIQFMATGLLVSGVILMSNGYINDTWWQYVLGGGLLGVFVGVILGYIEDRTR